MLTPTCTGHQAHIIIYVFFLFLCFQLWKLLMIVNNYHCNYFIHHSASLTSCELFACHDMHKPYAKQTRYIYIFSIRCQLACSPKKDASLLHVQFPYDISLFFLVNHMIFPLIYSIKKYIQVVIPLIPRHRLYIISQFHGMTLFIPV